MMVLAVCFLPISSLYALLNLHLLPFTIIGEEKQMSKSRNSIFEFFKLRLSKLIFRKPKHQEESQYDAEECDKR